MTDDEKMQLYVSRVLELLGGRDQAFRIMEAEFNEMNARWNKDVLSIGRILRSHLHVEHYLTQFIRHTNPLLGNLTAARLTFAQKIELINDTNVEISMFIPGMRHLNKIRNRLAHNLDGAVTEDDARVFLKNEFFSRMREEGARHEGRVLSQAPLDILEEFSEFVSMMLSGTYSVHAKAAQQAMADMTERWKFAE